MIGVFLGWILTDGINTGCIREIGLARQLYGTAYHDEVEIIALANYNSLYPGLRKRLEVDHEKEIIISPFHTDVDVPETQVLESNHRKVSVVHT